MFLKAKQRCKDGLGSFLADLSISISDIVAAVTAFVKDVILNQDSDLKTKLAPHKQRRRTNHTFEYL